MFKPACIALALTTLLIGCSSARQSLITPEPAAPIAAPQVDAKPSRAVTPTLRTDGDTPQRHQRILAEASQGGHEIAFLGASTLERWPTVGKDTWESTWLPRHPINCGIGGDRTQHLLGRMDDGLLDALAAPNNNIRWVVLNIGSNNTDTDRAADIAEGTLAVLDRLRTRLPAAKIAFILTTPRGRWPGPVRDTILALNTRLRSMLAGRADIHLIDIGDRFVLPSGELSPGLVPDAIHPTDEGYRIWTEALQQVIK